LAFATTATTTDNLNRIVSAVPIIWGGPARAAREHDGLLHIVGDDDNARATGSTRVTRAVVTTTTTTATRIRGANNRRGRIIRRTTGTATTRTACASGLKPTGIQSAATTTAAAIISRGTTYRRRYSGTACGANFACA
jgi:hypothetical protein